MVVDDDWMLLDMMNSLLPGVTDAEIEIYENPLEALSALRRRPDDYEMLITDRNMPQMDGVGLLVLAREAVPHLRFLMMTGNQLHLARELELFELPHSVLPKPFGLPGLKAALEAAPVIQEESVVRLEAAA
jgi:CheY-like chemotaxis protein